MTNHNTLLETQKMSLSLAVVTAGFFMPLGLSCAAEVPAAAQIIDWKSFNVLPTVLPPAEANDSTVLNPQFDSCGLFFAYFFVALLVARRDDRFS